MTAPATVETDFQTALDTISGLRASIERPKTVVPPHAWPELKDDEGFITFGDDAVLLYDLYLIVPAQKSRQDASEVLRPYLARSGGQSIYAAVLAQMGAIVRNFRLTRTGDVPVMDGSFYGAVWRVEVIA